MSDEQTPGWPPRGPSGGFGDDGSEPETMTSATRRITRRELREAEARRAAAAAAQTPVPPAGGSTPVPPATSGAGQPVLPAPGTSPWGQAAPTRATEAPSLPPARPRWSQPSRGDAGSLPPVTPSTGPFPPVTGSAGPAAEAGLPVRPPVQHQQTGQPPAPVAGPGRFPSRTEVPTTGIPAAGPRPTGESRTAGGPAAGPAWPAPAMGAEPLPAAVDVVDDSPLALLGGGLEPPVEHHEPARRRNHRARSLLVLLVAIAMVAGVGYVAKMVFWPGGGSSSSVQDYPGPGGPTVQVVVNAGDTGAEMAKTLQQAGVVATTSAFTKAYKANPDAAKIQPGTYNLLLKMKASDAVAALLDPASKASLKVTIPEGLTAAQILQKISEKTTIPLADLQAAAADPAAIGLPQQAGGKVEGWLFPATYEVDPKATAASVLSQMVAKTTQVLAAKGVSADQQEAVLTKASLIEKEASRDEDRPKMARVIENRLAKNMPLQIDTATGYGLNKSAMNLTPAELADTSNPYNLRVLTGLPPTPISSPGEPSIDAVLAPADGSWLFWVTVDLNTGETVFTDNYTDFLAAKKQFTDWLAAHQTATATP